MPHIKAVYNRLQELREALTVFKQLVAQEREDIVGLNLAGLQGRSQEIDSFFARLQELNRQTASEIAAACRVGGVSGEAGLSALLPVIPKSDREQFVTLQNTVRALGEELENSLAVNRALLKDSLQFADSSLQLLTSALKRTGTSVYGQQGRYVETVDQPRIICKEI